MSDVYIQRMRFIRDDLNIARDSFAFVLTNWGRQEVAGFFRLWTQTRIQKAAGNLETTYLVRLTAEFEGILKDHLRTNHPDIVLPPNRRDRTVDWFLARVSQRENIAIPPELRAKLNQVRDYRNSLAHGNPAVFAVTFTEALGRYNTFLSLLPGPRG